MQQQGDIVLYQTPNGGDICIDNGIIAMDGGLSTCVYLSLFGGNEDDNGLANNSATWWGNIDVDHAAQKYISLTQHILKSLPATSFNLIKLNDAVEADLDWLLSEKIMTSIIVAVSIPKMNEVHISIEMANIQGVTQNLQYTQNWEHSK